MSCANVNTQDCHRWQYGDHWGIEEAHVDVQRKALRVCVARLKVFVCNGMGVRPIAFPVVVLFFVVEDREAD